MCNMGSKVNILITQWSALYGCLEADTVKVGGADYLPILQASAFFLLVLKLRLLEETMYDDPCFEIHGQSVIKISSRSK